MEHRWSGHLATIDVIQSNRQEVIVTLETLRDSCPEAELSVMAAGLLTQLMDNKFSFITVFLSLLLHLVEPISRQLQGETIDVHAAVELINAVRAEVQGMRSDEKFQSIIEESNVNIQEQDIQKTAIVLFSLNGENGWQIAN